MFEPNLEWLTSLPLELTQTRVADSSFADQGDTLGDDLIRSLGWTLLIADHFDGSRFDLFTNVRSFQYAAIGFLSPEVDHNLGQLSPFGVILYADQAPDDEQALGVQGGFDIDTPGGPVPVPVVVRRGRFEDHLPPPGVPGGSAAYWATSRGGAIQGWLTARHVADSALFGASGHTVLERASSCIDAAIVDVGVAAPTVAHAPAHQAITAGLPVEMACRPGVAATVLDVSANLRISRSTRFPLRFALSHTGHPGDSGSAIEETRTPGHSPLGIYLGSYLPDTPFQGHVGRAGFGLAISQLELLMNLEVFR